jgi:mannitol/fructose-specific phosphotransferase system IIA component (Ntr-type)
MAIATSLVSGPLIKDVLKLSSAGGFWNYLKPPVFRRFTSPISAEQIIGELSADLAQGVEKSKNRTSLIDLPALFQKMPNPVFGIGHGVAVPHVRLEGIHRPHLAVGVTDVAIDVQAPDEIPVRVFLLLVTPKEMHELPLQIYADIGRVFTTDTVFDKVVTARNHTEFVAAVKSANNEC